MPITGDTAYPRLASRPSASDLARWYTPNDDEVAFARMHTRADGARLALLVLLKTFQHLGRFEPLASLPSSIVEHIARSQGFLFLPDAYLNSDRSSARHTHISLIRGYLGVKPFSAGGEAAMTAALRDIAGVREDIPDLINAAVEELVRQRFELPGFSTIDKAARRVRLEVNAALHTQIAAKLSPEARSKLEALLTTPGLEAGTTAWQTVKRDAGRATAKNLRTLLEHRRWLVAVASGVIVDDTIPEVKRRQFAAEASSLDASRMRDLRDADKRLALAATLVQVNAARVVDNLIEMFVKRMVSLHNAGKRALETYRNEHQASAERLIRTLREALTAFTEADGDSAKLAAVGAIFGDATRSGAMIEQCEAFETYADNNYAPFLWRIFAEGRATVFRLWRDLPVQSTTGEDGLERALAFVYAHEAKRNQWLEVEPDAIDLAWVSDPWWRLITGLKRRGDAVVRVNRRHLETCVFTRLMTALKSGDACVDGSLEYADYRRQLLGDAELDARLERFGLEVGLPVDADAFVDQVRAWLEQRAEETDTGFPTNAHVRFERGELVLKRTPPRATPPRLGYWTNVITARLRLRQILDVLASSEQRLNWTRFFGPLSGFDAKLERPRERYVATTFCYGCNLGPSQTARALSGFDRQGIEWINARHITDEDLERAINEVINAYNRFEITRHWGSGESASADGTKWDVYEQNLLAEYHLRYGGYGGLGYYHVSDKYIALFSRFAACGTYEATYVLDGMIENDSEIKPTRVHTDTHGKSTPVFGMAFLLGIELMPRIKDWKRLVFVRPNRTVKYAHIDAIFTDTVDWEVIRRSFRELLRVVVSVRAGRISASTVLKRLSSFSRRNTVFAAFFELGRAIRTGFLLRYIADAELRSSIQTAMNKSEQFNYFLDWVSFGGDVINTNDRDEQRKRIRFNHLLANLVMFETTADLTRALRQLRLEGVEVPNEVLGHMSPFVREHINLLGEYQLSFEQQAEPLEFGLDVEVTNQG